mmetsp:Transcript_32049/g.90145  ORF Transcript_32049/g.90145 Transcript_32049/m.90145 type:complete len:744 (+) Transcript_32049:214-2445(+)
MASSNVTVCIRSRPFLPREKEVAVVHVNGNTVRIHVDVDQLYGAPEVEQRQFVFDLCLGQDTSQEALYDQVGEPILKNTLDGFQGTLFAYGQTGSGKSFSIMGPESNPGIIPRLTKRLFEVIDNDPREDPASEVRLGVSFLEIYNEELKDLLDPRPRQKKLYVHQHPKLGVHVPHLTEAAASSCSECSRLMDFGAKVRATAQTNMNSTSSRSHSVLTLSVTQVFPNGKIRNSSVNLCDLAGSERVKKSGAVGQRMREGSSINSSLSVLGQVISKLAAGAGKGVHVPFRQSKLTHILMDALSGNSLTTMLANVSPAQSEADESLSTLRFAESVKKVKTKPQVTEMAPEEPAMMLASFQGEIDVLQRALCTEGTALPGNSELAQALEASEQLMKSFAMRSGAIEGWAEAKERTKALKVVQQQLLDEMSLSVHEIGQLAGVDSRTPYLLNISDDPSLSGSLLYFLRSEPDISTVGSSGPESIAPNNIRLEGLGIPARLCEIRYSPGSGSVRICKVSGEAEMGRLLVNGRPLEAGAPVELKHADRLVFGWAFCFRLIVQGSGAPAGESFESVSKEVLEYSMTSTLGDMSVMRAAGQWQAELLKRGAEDGTAEALMEEVGKLMVLLEEANALCKEVHDVLPAALSVEMDIGFCFSFSSCSRPPNVVAQVWKRGGARLLAAWPAADFERRLMGLRDAHREVLKKHHLSQWVLRLSSEDWWAGEALLGGGGRNTDPDSEPERDAVPIGPH